jgi:hypothetical protein
MSGNFPNVSLWQPENAESSGKPGICKFKPTDVDFNFLVNEELPPVSRIYAFRFIDRMEPKQVSAVIVEMSSSSFSGCHCFL